MKPTRRLEKRRKIDVIDVLLFLFLTIWGLVILLPFVNVIAISFSSYKEYLETPLLLIPQQPELKSYQELFEDGRIWVGYRTTIIIVLIGVPLSLFLTSSMGYALSRNRFPGKKGILLLVLFTMIFQGGIVPLYLVMRDLHLTNTIWSVILCSGMNTFYMILMYNYFQSLPDSLIESAKLDGAGEWTILFRIVLPSAVPGILAGVILAIGRIVGETAALMYTAGTVAQIPDSVMGSGRTLALHMYTLSSEGLHTDQAYATAVILLILVIVINTVSAQIAKKITKGNGNGEN